MKRSLEYDAFLDNNLNRIELVDAINEKGEWNGKYPLHPIYCPDCPSNPQAELFFTSRSSRTSEHLSTLPSSNHNHECPHNHPEASKSIANDYYQRCNRQQAYDKMAACLRRLDKVTVNPVKGNLQPVNNINPLVIDHPNNQGQRLRLKTKSFSSIYKLSQEDIGMPIVFYGKVKLKIEKRIKANDSSSEFNVILIKSANNEKILHSVYFDNNTLDIKENRVYKFSLVGEPYKKGKYINVGFYHRHYDWYIIEET